MIKWIRRHTIGRSVTKARLKALYERRDDLIKHMAHARTQGSRVSDMQKSAQSINFEILKLEGQQ